ncbi:hypothetical protein D3C81_2170560 [compost metagenome]
MVTVTGHQLLACCQVVNGIQGQRVIRTRMLGDAILLAVCQVQGNKIASTCGATEYAIGKSTPEL